MKSKLTMGVFALALVAALIAGATSAWFTAEAEVPEVEFTAGTLEINVDKKTHCNPHARAIHRQCESRRLCHRLLGN
jgi:predicted ribosomally synthesized peptide with SipW-like signal peptide